MYDKDRGCVRGEKKSEQQGFEETGELTPWADMLKNPRNERERSAAHRMKKLKEDDDQCLSDYAELVKEYQGLEKVLSDLVEEVETLLVDSVICLKRHAQSEWMHCPSCVAEDKIRVAVRKAKEVLPKFER